MCRWLAYLGPEMFMDELLLQPSHSLIDQSLDAREIEWPTNGDGFGVGWYGTRDTPGLFRDVLPIWNDTNLHALAHQIRTSLFFAHVRKATAGGIQRSNCHPFRYDHWLFQHNGSVPGFDRMRQSLYADIDADLFDDLKGSTDSECMFYLALTYGLRDDPPTALRRMVERIEHGRAQSDVAEPFHCACAVSDGATIWALRYVSHGEARTLYYSQHAEALCDFAGCDTLIPNDAVIIASEPLGTMGSAWTRIEPGSLLTANATGVHAEPILS
ncbi:MAG: class II glutamine amidotransferase [Planctomycetota bacterium]